MIKEILAHLRCLSWRIGWVNHKFPGTKIYWQHLYAYGGNSGPGSYNRLAIFKANFINSLLEAYDINNVIELGCGDGNQLSLFKIKEYVGFDISPFAVKYCKNKFVTDKSKKFFVYDGKFAHIIASIKKAELALSLDVIFHLIEEDIFERYMSDLFSASKKYIIIYSSNYNSRQVHHEKHHKFSDWISLHAPEWNQIQFFANPYPFSKKDPENTSESNFYVYALNEG